MTVRGSNVINSISEPSCNVICSGQCWKTAFKWLEDQEGSDTVVCEEDFTVLNIVIEFMK